MKIVIDTNLIFSSFLKKNARELDIIKSSKHDIYFCQFTTLELFKHKEKIVECSKLNEEEIFEAYQLVLKNVKIVVEKDIPKEIIREAEGLCKDIDENDTIFVATSIFLDAKLWSGDSKLSRGLKKKGFDRIIAINDIH